MRLMIEIISAVPDPSDSYFFGDFPPWCAWVAATGLVLGFVATNYSKRINSYELANFVDKIGSLLIALGVWLPIILINLDRPIVLIIVTLIAFFVVKSFWREEYGENEKKQPLPYEGKYNSNGEKDGYWIEFYDRERTRKMSHAYYRDGKMVSCEVWKPNGEKCNETSVINGDGIMVHYWDAVEKDGTFHKDFEWHFKDGKITENPNK